MHSSSVIGLTTSTSVLIPSRASLGSDSTAISPLPSQPSRTLQKLEKLIHRHARRTNQRPQRPHRKLLVLWNGEIGSLPRLRHHQMASHLPDHLPATPHKRLRRVLAGDVAKLFPWRNLSRHRPVFHRQYSLAGNLSIASERNASAS